VFCAHAPGDALRRAEQIGQHRGAAGLARVLRMLEQQGGAGGPQDPVADFGHFQVGGNGVRNALELALAFQLGDEVPEVAVFPAVSSIGLPWRRANDYHTPHPDGWGCPCGPFLSGCSTASWLCCGPSASSSTSAPSTWGWPCSPRWA